MNTSLSNKISEIKIEIGQTLISALKKMDETEKKLLIVFDTKEKFRGVLSIGDIQRAVLDNLSLDVQVGTVLRKRPTLAYAYENPELIKSRMFDNRIECMPILDKDENLIDVLFWDEVFGKKEPISDKINLPVVVMAGGKGTRMKPLTNVIPKPLIPVEEKTILEDIMDQFVGIGCKNFYLSVNYKADMIKQYLTSLNNPNYNVKYFQEDVPLGTAGSLYLVKDKIESTFFVTNCDIIVKQDLVDVYKYHVENKNDITIIAALKHYKIPYGTLETGIDGLLEDLSEKPEITFKINSGVYLLEPSVIKEIPENTFFHITDLILKIKKQGMRVGVFPISEKSWIDYGLIENLPFLVSK